MEMEILTTGDRGAVVAKLVALLISAGCAWKIHGDVGNRWDRTGCLDKDCRHAARAIKATQATKSSTPRWRIQDG